MARPLRQKISNKKISRFHPKCSKNRNRTHQARNPKTYHNQNFISRNLPRSTQTMIPSKTKYCKACKQHIPLKDWLYHITKHKQRLNAKLGNHPSFWNRIEWDDVIRDENPTQAPPLPTPPPQKTIPSFQNEYI